MAQLDDGPRIAALVAECRQHGVAIRLGSAVTAIDANEAGCVVRCANGDRHECGAAILTLPLPLLKEIALPAPEREKAAAAAKLGP